MGLELALALARTRHWWHVECEGGVQWEAVLATTQLSRVGDVWGRSRPMAVGKVGHCWALGTHEQATGSGLPIHSLRHSVGDACPVAQVAPSDLRGSDSQV